MLEIIEVDCSLIKVKGKVIGVTLVAQFQHRASMFCTSMPHQLVDGTGFIRFTNGKITFVNSHGDEVSFLIEGEDAKTLQTIIKERKLYIYRYVVFTHGFKIIVEGMEKMGIKTELTRL